MSDPSLEEDSLISQDDIDKLLDASSIEEAEEQLEAVDGTDNDLDDLGELSQDDIDSLLNGSALDGDEEADPEDDGGELSQDDIDSLMGGGPSQEDLGGELSQEDIDNMMNGPADDDGGGDESDEDDIELISQDDIDRLMNPSEGDTQDGDDDELISMADIQGLVSPEEEDGDELEEDFVPAEPVSPDEALQGDDVTGDIDSPDLSESLSESDPGEVDPLDAVIDETDAMDVADCILTQETMDELILNAMDSGDVPEGDELGPVVLDEELPSDVQASAQDVDGMDDIDQFLEADDSFEPDLNGGDEGDVTQDDIDALLQDSDDEDDFMDDDDILISQDDIDTLLMAADQEDEDVLGDTLAGGDDGDLDDFDDEDFLDSDIFDEPDTEADQVVLEGADAQTESSDEPVSSPRWGKMGKLFKSKLVLAAVSVFLVLGISVPAVYFMFFSQAPPPLPEKETVPLVGRAVDVPDITIEEDIEQIPMRQSGTIILSDFIILASDRSKNMTYVYADISIDYSDQRAYHEVNNNSSFYRDLIYESIRSGLVSEKGNEVTEADLIWGVETSLKKVLPPHYIQKISFKKFRTS